MVNQFHDNGDTNAKELSGFVYCSCLPKIWRGLSATLPFKKRMLTHQLLGSVGQVIPPGATFRMLASLTPAKTAERTHILGNILDEAWLVKKLQGHSSGPVSLQLDPVNTASPPTNRLRLDRDAGRLVIMFLESSIRTLYNEAAKIMKYRKTKPTTGLGNTATKVIASIAKIRKTMVDLHTAVLSITVWEVLHSQDFADCVELVMKQPTVRVQQSGRESSHG